MSVRLSSSFQLGSTSQLGSPSGPARAGEGSGRVRRRLAPRLRPRLAVITFPGSNCDTDVLWAAREVLGYAVEPVWYEFTDLQDFDAVILPGGFSYGDYLRCGAIARYAPVMEAVRDFAGRGGAVLGICNGFQILLEAGLLPGALRRNRDLLFHCQDVWVRVENNRTPFTWGLQPGTVLRLPIAHGEGNYFADRQTLATLQNRGQVVFRYCGPDGQVVPGTNPNGSLLDIAGICNACGNVVGLMPHPERAVEDLLGSTDGQLILRGIADWLEHRRTEEENIQPAGRRPVLASSPARPADPVGCAGPAGTAGAAGPVHLRAPKSVGTGPSVSGLPASAFPAPVFSPTEPTPEQIASGQLWRPLGLRDSEYELVCEALGRRPNWTELGMYSVLWSEHCAYKHTRPLFPQFPTTGPRVLQGPGENAGAIDIGHGQAVVFKVESHNHPSAVEPYQGAATGVGGILRDIFTMGARPVAVLDSLRFGPLDEAHTRFLVQGIVAGIAGYGNSVGVPTVGGEFAVDECYRGNPLVNVLCVGIAPHSRIIRAEAKGVGNPVMVVGARTGRDGIHGATFASVQLDEESESRRPAVQVGDPFMEKLLIEACLEAMDKGLILGIQDMGAAGLTSSAAEMAARAGNGIEMDLARVPRRARGLTPYEMMLSESQERMLVVPQPGREAELQALFRRWGLAAEVVGRVTDDGIFRVWDGGRLAAAIPVRSLVDGAPTYTPAAQEPAYLAELRAWQPSSLPLPAPAEYANLLLALLARPSIASKRWVWRQYDHMVQTNTVLRPGGDAAVLRVRPEEPRTWLGVEGHGDAPREAAGSTQGLAITMDGNGRYCYLDPYWGAQIAVAEAARNVSMTGAEPLGITDGLNFGNPEKPEIYWQLREAVRGLADGCRALGIPVVSGNASLYNETNGDPIYPTPVVGLVGLLEDVRKAVGIGFTAPGDVVVLLGGQEPPGADAEAAAPGLGGSEYQLLRMGRLAGRPPALDWRREKALQAVVREAARNGWLHSAHDCSEGGLAVALAECCLAGPPGNPDHPVRMGVDLRAACEGVRPDAFLFGESQSRAVVSVPPGRPLSYLTRLAEESGVPATVLGFTGGDRFRFLLQPGPLPPDAGTAAAMAAAATATCAVGGPIQIDLPLDALAAAWESSLERSLARHGRR